MKQSAFDLGVSKAQIKVHLAARTTLQPYPDLLDLAHSAANWVWHARRSNGDEAAARGHTLYPPQYGSVRLTFLGKEQITVGEVVDALHLEELL